MTTHTTHTASRADHALQAMEANAFRVSQVTARLLAANSSLPELLSVRPRATADEARVDLQPHTIDEARRWAAALGVPLRFEDADGYSTGYRARRSSANTVVEGVTVHVGTYTEYAPDQWADLQAAEAVSA